MKIEFCNQLYIFYNINHGIHKKELILICIQVENYQFYIVYNINHGIHKKELILICIQVPQLKLNSYVLA